jgi:hypothetical protein
MAAIEAPPSIRRAMRSTMAIPIHFKYLKATAAIGVTT